MYANFSVKIIHPNNTTVNETLCQVKRVTFGIY